MDFITQLFTDLGTTDSLMVLLFLIGAALIGWLFGRWSLSGQLKNLKNELAQRDRDVVTLENNLATLQKQLGEREDDIAKLRIQLTEWEATADKLNRQKSQFKIDLQNANHEVSELREQHNDYEEEIDALRNQIIGLKAKNNQLNVEIERDENIYDDLTVLQKAFNQSLLRIEKLEEKLTATEQAPVVIVPAVPNTSTPSPGGPVAEIGDNGESTDSDDDFADESTSAGSDVIEMLSAEERAAKARTRLKNAIGNLIPPASIEHKDDLKKIEGIGPFIEGKLNAVGLYTYEQISQLDDDLIEQVTNAIQFFPGRIKRDNWVGQAASIMNG